jgi:hypothetical protein
MREPDDTFQDTWAGLSPEQPRDGSQRLKWVLVGLLALLILCLCGAGIYLLAREFLAAPTPVSMPPVPTDEGGLAEAPEAQVTVTLGQAGPTSEPTPTLGLAPTLHVEPTQPAAPVTQGAAVDAAAMAAPPVIDGDLGEWLGQPGVLSAFRVFQVADWDGTDDLRAVWRLGWDQDHLYVAVSVEDDIHVQTQAGNLIFRGDSVDIQFDTDREGDLGPRLSPDDYQITMSPGDFGALPPSAFRFRGQTDGRILDAPGHNVRVAARQTAVGYDLEAAIPWADLGLTPFPGLVIGIALNANDNDTPGTAVQEVMMSHVATRTLTDPTGWGTLTLRE